MYGTTKYIDVLPKLIDNYNISYHSGINGVPNKINAAKLEELNMNKYKLDKQEETVFNIGDTVRYLLNKKLFDKGSIPHWSKHIHTIVHLCPR